MNNILGCLEKVLTLLVEKNLKEISPTINYLHGPDFHEALGLSRDECPDLSEVLETLVEEGVLRKHKVGSIPSCPSCGSFKLMVRLTCPVCGSINIRKVDSITHLACGFTAPSDKFEYGDLLRCPSCGKTLKALGVDYGRFTDAILCDDCGKLSFSPRVIFECSDCGTVSTEKELSLKPVYRYEVVSERLLARRPIAADVVRLLRERGFDVKAPKEVIGLSGVVHRFSLAARRGGKEHIIDIVRSNEAVDEYRILALFGKMMDSSLKKAILIAIPKASENAKTLAGSLGIRVIEASCLDEVIDKITDIMEELEEKEDL